MKYLIVLFILFFSCQKSTKHQAKGQDNPQYDSIINAVLENDSITVKQFKKDLLNKKENSKTNKTLQNYIKLYEYRNKYEFEKIDQLDWNNIDELFNSGYPTAAIDFAFHKLDAKIYTENDAEFLTKVDTYLNVFKDYKKDCEYGKLLQVKITYLQKKGYYSLALKEMYNLIRNYSTNENCSDLLSSTQFEMSFLYSFLKIPSESLKSAQLGLKLAKSNDNLALGNSLIARAYLDLKQPELGIDFIKKALQLENKDNVHMLNYYKAILIQTYADLKENEKVDELFLNFEQSKGYMAYHEFLFCLAKAKSLSNRKLYEESIKVYLRAKKLLNKEHLLNERIILKDLADVYKLNNNLTVAYEYLLEYQKNEDEFTKSSNENRISEQMVSLDLAKKEAFIHESKRKAIEKDLNIAKQNKTIAIGSFISISLIVFIVAVLYFNSIYKRKNQELEVEKQIVFETNNELKKSLDQNTLLLKEIHHRVKNNLQIIISLLNIQSHNGKEILMDDFIEKAQARITSMSLIHQSLYENDTIDRIDFDQYIKKLTQNLMHVYGVTSQGIIQEIKAENIFFDIQTAIPLGLILNELISNTLKYAFTEYSNATISIQIEAKENGYYCLTFADNGKGFNAANKINKSMGLELIHLLALQLKGTIEKQNTSGTEYVMEFKAISY